MARCISVEWPGRQGDNFSILGIVGGLRMRHFATRWAKVHSRPQSYAAFLNYVSCSSGNGQKFILFDWPIQTV